MIARVKIAPLGRWCDYPLKSAEENGANAMSNVGTMMGILTETMQKSEWCDGKAWTQEDASIDEMRVRAGLLPRRYDLGPRLICEHMLEMD